MALGAPDDVETPWRLLIIAIGFGLAALLVQGAMRWGARIDDREVVIVGPAKTVRIPRERVDHFELQQEMPYIGRAVEVD